MKMEKIAKKQLNGFAGLTDIFINEVQTSSNSDGFIHAPSGFHFKLFNNSEVHTLSGDEKNSKGKRSNLNVYDESGWLSEEYIVDTSAFTVQDSSFQLGGNVDTSTLPEYLPNQILLCSSASDIDSEFYKRYKDYTKKMIAYGSTGDYFTANIDCDLVINATCNGKKLDIPLLSKVKVEGDISSNPSKYTREYYNHFDTDGGEQAPIKRVDIMRNSKIYVPVLANDDLSRKRYFGIARDPANNYDNSIIMVAEYFKNQKNEWAMRYINCVNLTDIEKKKKTPLPRPEQIKILKQIILDYNGVGMADYENIEFITIDAGSGGGGNTEIFDLIDDWKDKDGNTHRGITDLATYEEESKKYPNAIDKLRMIEPRKFKDIMFDEFINLLSLGVIEFPAEYDNKDYIMLPIEGNEIEVVDEETGEKRIEKSVEYEKKTLSLEEQMALTQLNLAKEELIGVRTKGTGANKSYVLPSDIAGSKLKDDRAYCSVLLAHQLALLRRNDKFKQDKPKSDVMDYCFF